jgi:hypothetical protein
LAEDRQNFCPLFGSRRKYFAEVSPVLNFFHIFAQCLAGCVQFIDNDQGLTERAHEDW